MPNRAYVLDVTHTADGQVCFTAESVTSMLRARAALNRQTPGRESAVAELEALADSFDVTAINYTTHNGPKSSRTGADHR